MDLQSTIIPKIEVEIPSTLDLNEHIIPAIKDWKVGEDYMVKLAVHLKSLNQGDMNDPNNQACVRAYFEVMGGEAIEMQNDKPGYTGKDAFLRALNYIASRLENGARS